VTYKKSRSIDLISSSLFGALLAMSLGMVLFTGTPARADASCAGLLQSKIAYIEQHGGWFFIDMSIHREDVRWVSYSAGTVSLDGTALTGQADQIFSDRPRGIQPFDIYQQDWLSLDLSSDGLLHIRSITWSFDTYWDMSCQGELVTKYFPGYGTITLAFRGWGTIF